MPKNTKKLNIEIFCTSNFNRPFKETFPLTTNSPRGFLFSNNLEQDKMNGYFK